MDAERSSGRKPDVRVGFIAGTSWSGSTLLEQALAQVDGCVSLGELYWLWNRDWPLMVCECGQEFRSCAFWRTVLDDAYGSRWEVIRSQVAARGAGLLRHSIGPTLAHSSSRLRPAAALVELGEMVQPVYRSVQHVSNASTILDASKCALWGLAISMADAIDLRVVHLVRHQMGFVSSDGRRRAVPYPPGATRPPRPPVRSLITWMLLNIEAEYLSRRVPASVCVLYEDLVLDPSAAARRVARLLGADPDLAALFVNDTLTVRRTGHAIGGNPRRPRLGQTVIASSTPSAELPSRTSELIRRSLAVPLWGRYQRAAHSVPGSGSSLVRTNGSHGSAGTRGPSEIRGEAPSP
jgi:hypothetical protein